MDQVASSENGHGALKKKQALELLSNVEGI